MSCSYCDRPYVAGAMTCAGCGAPAVGPVVAPAGIGRPIPLFPEEIAELRAAHGLDYSDLNRAVATIQAPQRYPDPPDLWPLER